MSKASKKLAVEVSLSAGEERRTFSPIVFRLNHREKSVAVGLTVDV